MMTCMMYYVILAKMKTNYLKSILSKTTYFLLIGGGGGLIEGGGLNKYLNLKRGLIRERGGGLI